MMPGETLLDGAAEVCTTCKKKPTVKVMRSATMGYFVGSTCDCGPYSRESDYYEKGEDADKDLPGFIASIADPKTPPPASARKTGYNSKGSITITVFP